MPPCTCIFTADSVKKNPKINQENKNNNKKPGNHKSLVSLWSQPKPITRPVVSGSSGQADDSHCRTAAIAVPSARLLLISPVPKVAGAGPSSTAPLSPVPLSANLQLHVCLGCAGKCLGLCTSLGLPWAE